MLKSIPYEFYLCAIFWVLLLLNQILHIELKVRKGTSAGALENNNDTSKL